MYTPHGHIWLRSGLQPGTSALHQPCSVPYQPSAQVSTAGWDGHPEFAQRCIQKLLALVEKRRLAAAPKKVRGWLWQLGVIWLSIGRGVAWAGPGKVAAGGGGA